ncbi:NAD(P)H dehydrogenase (quinone) [Rhynchospora pubera]|uniref:NAD(P)H dehydrogenase (quinone) n=1 Tax=Rhynchospora pubera TaxID=906938 RepID=A0AAV8FYU6_9POAL|nr:NAD(P)H dehydrogenase (quinone) [Rhynchospora pubera]
MGKGGGCVPSKKQKPPVATGNTSAAAPSAPREIPVTSEETVDVDVVADSTVVVEQQPSDQTLKVFIVFYSMYGHVESLAKRMKKGVDGIDGVEAVLYRVAETLPQEVLDKMHAPPKDESIPILTAAELEKADGLLFGFPTRYGAMAAQMKAFFDSTGQLWQEQKLAGKPAGFFVSTGTQGGGQETTAWTAITQLAHHGMLFVPIGYTFGAGMFSMDEVKGGSPYGAGVYAGDGSREASEAELSLAEHQGKYMASIVKRMFTS